VERCFVYPGDNRSGISYNKIYSADFYCGPQFCVEICPVGGAAVPVCGPCGICLQNDKKSIKGDIFSCIRIPFE
jgi:hypothetical protein